MSTKKSLFPAVTTVSANGFFDYVSAGVNYKISFSDLVSNLGVTGTLVQAGSATGTPVLDIQGAVNNIRTIEDGAGIQSSLSPENGITLAHNFAEDTTGIELLDDITAASPVFPSLIPGTGVQISKAGNVITISATGALPATKTVFINQESDFPAADAGVITLEPGTIYIIANDISTSNRFVLMDKTVVRGSSTTAPMLAYTGSGIMFSGADVEVSFYNVRFECPTGTAFGFTDTVGGVYRFAADFVAIPRCANVGTIDNYGVFTAERLACTSISTQGLIVTGANYNFVSTTNTTFSSANASANLLDVSGVVSQVLGIDGCLFIGAVGTKAIVGAASDGNLTASGRGIVSSCSFLLATPLTGLDNTADLQWKYSGNTGISDTNPDSLSHNTAGATVVIASTGVGVKVGGVWTDDNSHQFTVDGSGRSTYNGVDDFQVPITASLTAYPVTGSNKNFSVSIAINGTIVVASARVSRASSSDKPSVTVIWQHNFQTGDYVEVFLANDSDTTNFTVDHGIMRIN